MGDGLERVPWVGGSGEDDRVLGILSEPYVRRRYAEELDKAQRELFGVD